MGWLDEPKKRKAIPKHKKELLWKKYMKDKPEGKCYCCRKTTISFMNFQVGHNKAKTKGGSDSIENLRPICSGCNSSMGTKSIEVFRAKHFPKKSSKTAKSSDRLAELELKVRKYISALNYEILSHRHGFDVCAFKESTKDSYRAIGFNQNKTVTASNVRDFMKKTAKFSKTMADKYVFGSPDVQGLIAYTGELPKDVAVLVKSSKPQVKFKKF